MKKALIVLFVVLVCTAALPAKTNMLNLGVSVSPYLDWPMDTYVTRDVSLSWTRLGSDTFGFYSQLNPYIAMSGKNKVSDTTWKFSDYDWMGAGLETVLGWGGDFNFGPLGLVVGGGGYVDINYFSLTYDYMFLSLGLGAGVNVYFQPGSGSFLLNAGLTAAWKPYFTYTDLTNDYNYSDFQNGRFDVTFSVGIGWRTGGGSSRSRGSGSSSGGDDDW